ncbi:hypothetical protein SAMN05518871_10394 [Psychrobacillus sp. OK028]|nr:hypothetical protein SAMN05518871_10394 [Psychrobacillus sp. OK028]
MLIIKQETLLVERNIKKSFKMIIQFYVYCYSRDYLYGYHYKGEKE